MPFNLLLIPLLGGFIFVRYWNRTRYHAIRAEKERLLFLASIAGFIALIFAFLISSIAGAFFPCSPEHLCIPVWWRIHVPFEYSGIAFSAFCISALLWFPLNLIWDRGGEVNRVIQEDADPLEILLKRAQDRNMTVSLTMKNGKVYVGFVTHTFNPASPTRSISIYPTKSGYRDETTKEVVFTINYAATQLAIDKDIDSLALELGGLKERQARVSQRQQGGNSLDQLKSTIDKVASELEQLEAVVNDFELALPIEEITSVNIYNEYVHDKYFLPKPEKKFSK